MSYARPDRSGRTSKRVPCDSGGASASTNVSHFQPRRSQCLSRLAPSAERVDIVIHIGFAVFVFDDKKRVTFRVALKRPPK